MTVYTAEEYDALCDVFGAPRAELGLPSLPAIKTHGVLWTLALLRSLLHVMFTGHDAAFELIAELDDATHGVRAFVVCPTCKRRFPIALERRTRP